MLGKELLLVARALSNEKGVSEQVVLNAIEAAIESATQKKYLGELKAKVNLNPQNGTYTTSRVFDVVEESDDFDENFHILASDPKVQELELKLDDVYEVIMDSITFGRIEAQAAKQVIYHKVREAERALVVEQYQNKVNTLVSGIVKRVTREFILVDLGGLADAHLSRKEILPHDIYRLGDRVRALLYNAEHREKGPQLFLSRTKPEMLMELFRVEVPEIGENIIEIKGASRDAGFRSKIAVTTNDGRIDPVGACVGMRGSRVQAVSGELGGERIDITLWDSNPAQFVINAMAPAEVASIIVDEEKNCMDLAIEDTQLSQAIGKNGQNVRLASQLTGWELNAMSVEDFNNKSSSESEVLINKFVKDLDIDAELASLLAENGFTTIDEISYVPTSELLEINGLDEDIINELRARANDVILARALNSNDTPNSLLDIDGVDEDLANKLSEKNIKTVEDLADCAILDLQEVVPEINNEDAGNIIMQARKIWE